MTHDKITREWLKDRIILTLIMDGKTLRREITLQEYNSATFDILGELEYLMYKKMMETYK